MRPQMKDYIKILEEMDQRFIDHKLESSAFTPDQKAGYYVLRSPQSSSYWTQINFAPGLVTISGDLSPFMITGKPMDWLLTAATSHPADIVRHVSAGRFGPEIFKFDQERAGEWLKQKRIDILNQYGASDDEIDEDEIDEADIEKLDKLEEAGDMLSTLNDTMADHRHFLAKIDADENTEFLEISNDFLWKIAALRCLARHYQPVDKVQDVRPSRSATKRTQPVKRSDQQKEG